MCRIHPPQRQIGGGSGGRRRRRRRRVSRLLRRTAVRLGGAGARRRHPVEAGPRRRDRLVTAVQVGHTGQRPRPLSVVDVHAQRAHQSETAGGCRRHHVRTTAGRECSRAGALGPTVRGARFRPH